MSKRRPYRDSKSKKLTNTTADYLKFDAVEAGWNLYVTTGSIEDETTTPTTLAFGRLDNDVFTPFEEEPSPAVGIRYHMDKTHRFMSGEIPAFRVEGLTANDVITGYIEGYLEKVD